MLEKAIGAIKNGQSRKTDNIGYTRHRTKINKTKNTAQKNKTKKMRSAYPTKYLGLTQVLAKGKGTTI
jgi:hypothetical protein